MRGSSRLLSSSVLSLILVSILASPAFGQRGMGDPWGVAGQAELPPVTTITGKVVDVETEPCESTTGRSYMGTHFNMVTDGGEELNVHLGPEVAVRDWAQQLTPGLEISAEVFRTDRMPEHAVVAKSIRYGDDGLIQLRDQGLRPLWAGPRGGRAPMMRRGSRL